MAGMADLDYVRALTDENAHLLATVGEHDWGTPIPTCPGWSLQQLVRHVGRGDRWAAQIIREQAEEAIDPRAVSGGKPPDEREGVLAWLGEGTRILFEAAAKADPAATVWTFLGPRPAGWWIRRRLHEATVHCADVAIATGEEYVLAPEVAADGISEWVGLLTAMQPAVLGADGSVLLQPKESELRSVHWRLVGSGVTEDASNRTIVRGEAAQLFLALTRRLTAEQAGLAIAGDQGLWDKWLAGTPF